MFGESDDSFGCLSYCYCVLYTSDILPETTQAMTQGSAVAIKIRWNTVATSSFLLLYEHTREDTLSNRMLQYNSLASYCKRVRLEVYLKTISLIIIRHITNTFFLFPSQLEQRDLSASKAHPFSSVPAMKYLRLYISRHHKYCISTMNPSVVRIGVAHETIHVELFTERVSVV